MTTTSVKGGSVGKTAAADRTHTDGEESTASLQRGERQPHDTKKTRKKPKATPLPRLKMLAVATTLLSEAMCTTMLLPFVGLFVAQLKGISVEEAGYSSGVLVGLFMLGQMISTRMWGWMSDVYGRRPPLLTGLFAGAVTILFFGMSSSLIMCCVFRFIHGFFNGNVLIAKVIIADITDDTNAALGFSLIAILWGCGAVVGPIIGGFLYDPVVNPSLHWLHVSPNSFVGRHPAFLASVMISIYGFSNFLLCFLVLPESNMTRSGSLRRVPLVGQILNWWKPKQVTIVNVASGMEGDSPLTCEGKIDPSVAGNAEGSIPKPDGASLVDPSEPHAGASSALVEPKKKKVRMTFKRALVDPVIRTVTLITMCLSFTDMAFVEVIPLWLIAPVDVGGLAMFSDGVGVLLLLCSISSVAFNLFFPKLARKVNNYKLIWMGSLLFFAASVVLTPLGSSFPPSVGFWVVWVTGSVKNCGCAAGFTVSQVLLGQIAPPGTLGELYGISQTLGILVRSVVPFVIAPLLAWSLSAGRSFPFNYYFTFFLSAVPLVMAMLICWKNPIQRSEGDIQQMASELLLEEREEEAQEASAWEKEKENGGEKRAFRSPSTHGKWLEEEEEANIDNEEEHRRLFEARATFYGMGSDDEEEENGPPHEGEGMDEEEGPTVEPPISMEEYRDMANSYATCFSTNFFTRMVMAEESREEEMQRWHRYVTPKGGNHHLRSVATGLQHEDFRLGGVKEEYLSSAQDGRP